MFGDTSKARPPVYPPACECLNAVRYRADVGLNRSSNINLPNDKLHCFGSRRCASIDVFYWAATTNGGDLVTENVLTDAVDGILTITINRPEKRNAVDLATAEAIGAAVDRLDAEDDLRVAVLTGAGSTFCAGMDLAAFARGERPVTAERGFAGLCTIPPAKPIIAAVEGHALGGGLELAMACDLIVAGSQVQFGLPEVRRGLIAAAGGVLRLPRKIPPQIAMEMVLTGCPIDAHRAAALGLINRVVEPGAALAGAYELARAISDNAPLAVQTGKDIVTRSAQWELVEAFELQRPAVQSVMSSQDAREGALAFAEKRAPVWQGC